MDAFGNSLHSYYQGNSEAVLVLRRDDGLEIPLPVRHFFRDAAEFTPIETAALKRCNGRVMDIGAGTGMHSLYLQRLGFKVTAIDLCPDAVAIMTARGVQHAHTANIFEFTEGPFETLLMLGHGIGMVQTLAGLDRFLVHARSLVHPSGALLVDSVNVRNTRDPKHRAYQQANERAGRYFGEIRLQFCFGDQESDVAGWLHVDEATLARHAAHAGWRYALVRQEPTGDYLAELRKT